MSVGEVQPYGRTCVQPAAGVESDRTISGIDSRNREEEKVSKDAVASVYTTMLNDDEFRDLVAEDPTKLDAFDLTDEERTVLSEEATTDVAGFSIGSGRAMSYLNHGPLLSPGVAQNLGIALNKASGLPGSSLSGPNFAAGAGCCPWNAGFVGRGSMVE